MLQAVGTKWNFLSFRPGLPWWAATASAWPPIPYYLTHTAETLGYHPQVILSGRRINDGMAAWVAEQTVKNVICNGSAVKGAKVIVLGLTFKEDCQHLRNSKVADLVRQGGGLTDVKSDYVPAAVRAADATLWRVQELRLEPQYRSIGGENCC